MKSIICRTRRLLDREAMVAAGAYSRSNSVPIMALSVLADMASNRHIFCDASQACRG